ncbi:MAG: nucleotidyltransferase family protein, partial [Eubacteriales bacterium]|nr:nucleotidyltransferase family protein [Eubacteriales bacterium]
MKTVAVICEYNPFHRGHEYQLMEIRRRFGDCRVVGVMSGAMTERGEPAILDKYSRAEAAVSCGCDLVVELPAPWSMAGAEFFARAGVSLASAVGADTLAFGSECGDIGVLRETAEFLSSEDYKSAIAAARDENPHLQAGALRNLVLEKNLGSVPTGSNDILAIEYLRATASLGVPLDAVTIKREGGDYNSPDKCAFASATAVRDMLRRGEDPSGFLPAASAEILKRENDTGRLCIRPLDEAVSAFLRLSWREMRGKMEVSGGIENRLHEAAKKRRDIEGILDLASERRYSRSRLRRA